MLSSSKLLIDNGSPGHRDPMGTAISSKTVCLPPSPMKNKTQYLQRCWAHIGRKKIWNYFTVHKKNTFVTVSFKKYQITLKTRWIFQDWKVTTFDQTCQHRAKSGSQEIWTHRFVHLGSKQCPTRIKFTFFSSYFECSHTCTNPSLCIFCPSLHPPCAILNTNAAFSNSYDSLLINRTTKKF